MPVMGFKISKSMFHWCPPHLHFSSSIISCVVCSQLFLTEGIGSHYFRGRTITLMVIRLLMLETGPFSSFFKNSYSASVELTAIVVSSTWEDSLGATREPEQPSEKVSQALRFLIASCRAWLSVSSRFSSRGGILPVPLTSFQPVGTSASLLDYPQGPLTNQHSRRPKTVGLTVRVMSSA